ncbi:MAG TPA: inositol monophosphatase family protein [Kofleriaceae bacterium]|jgi:myo-inositol-1(or 4)-monophosphatase
MIEYARRAVRAAAELLRGAHATEIRGKTNPRDLVTEWDLRSEDAIRAVLAGSGVPVLGEEGGGPTEGERWLPAGEAGPDRSRSGERWLVDPIDGTVNFAHGLPIWSISIALERAGQAVVGVVAAPVLGWWFEAERGGGARDGEGRPLHVSATPRLDRALLSTGFPYDRATSPVNNFAEWEHLQRVAGACRRLGAASLDLCLVGCGWLDGYWERKLKPWDLAAGALVAAEAGGIVTDTRGGPLDLHAGEVVATNGAIHEGLIAELEVVRRAREP